MRYGTNGDGSRTAKTLASNVREWEYAKGQDLMSFYIDNGRSILRFFFLASLTCFVIFMHRSNRTVMQTKIKASRMCLKYRETTENTKKAKIISSHITKTTTSTLHHKKEETKDIIITMLCY